MSLPPSPSLRVGSIILDVTDSNLHRHIHDPEKTGKGLFGMIADSHSRAAQISSEATSLRVIANNAREKSNIVIKSVINKT